MQMKKRKAGDEMISYEPFWKTLEQSSETTYTLIHKYKINPTTINRLRHDKPITTQTLHDVCQALGCKVQDVMEIT